MEFKYAMERATESVEVLNRAFAAMIIATADEMTDAQAQEADHLMREHPEWGYLDAAAAVKGE